jgi:hypothetical protein
MKPISAASELWVARASRVRANPPRVRGLSNRGLERKNVERHKMSKGKVRFGVTPKPARETRALPKPPVASCRA